MKFKFNAIFMYSKTIFLSRKIQIWNFLFLISNRLFSQPEESFVHPIYTIHDLLTCDLNFYWQKENNFEGHMLNNLLFSILFFSSKNSPLLHIWNIFFFSLFRLMHTSSYFSISLYSRSFYVQNFFSFFFGKKGMKNFLHVLTQKILFSSHESF